MAQELIIGLTEHRTFGYVFQAFLIEKKKSFYTITKLVKSRDIEALKLTTEQADLVKLIENYSDEKLIQKFSRKKEASKFFQQLDSELFEKHISPYIDKYMSWVISILQKGSTRLFLKQSKYTNLYDEDLIQVQPQNTICYFQFDRGEEGTKYSIQLLQDGKEISFLHKTVTPITHEPCSLLWQNKLFVFDKISAKRLLPFFQKEFISIPSQVEEKYYKSFVLNTIKDYRVKAKGFTISEVDSEPKVLLSLEPNLKMEAVFIPRFVYGEKEFLYNNKSDVVVNFQNKNGQYSFTKIKRNHDWEVNRLSILSQFGLKEKNGQFIPNGVDLLDEKERLYELISWLNQNKKDLEKEGFTISQNQYESTYSSEKPDIELKVKNNGDWFDIYSQVQFGEYSIPFIKLKKYILNGIREFELPNGEIAILPKEWFSEYKDVMNYSKAEGNALKINRYHAQILPKRLKGIDKSYISRLQDVGKKSSKLEIVPSNLEASLRPYQQQGFSWMFHLYEYQFGGCLADDMGLGKTLQALTLLLKLKRLKKVGFAPISDTNSNQGDLFVSKTDDVDSIQPATLIVMPTSLLHNWENEIKKFTPSLKVYKHFGQSRNRSESFKNLVSYYDIILTTYGMIRNDFELLSQHEFFYLILDESQNIKNPASKTYKAITRLKASHRLVLTGTPIENSLSDLWAQLNFINKGLLGNYAFFKREYITPIEKKNDPEKQEKLQMLIRPFVLRRTKDQVAKDLPPLTEQIRYCQMDTGQKSMYETEKSAIRNSILENIEKDGVEKSSFVVLQGLTKLRQLANHPSMLQYEEDTASSGKFDEIFRSLKSVVSENHKVLIFSSFVKHLELLKTQIEKQKWKYSLLTGQTVNREEVISKFQNDEENRIFLISLKAGGVGLNLTAADYVFIIDPWWNPAAELQAINRAHRIGQGKNVMVYRFITEESIEEKIQMLQKQKSTLADKFVNSNNPFKAITKEEIVNLFL